MILTIARQELRALFLSPLAWVILAVVQALLGYIFLSQVENYIVNQGQLAAITGTPGITRFVVAPWFGNVAFVLFLVVPMLTMRLISEERRSGTIALLYSAPISMTEIILGKYLGIVVFLGIMVSMLALMPLSLFLGGSIDIGLLAACLLGLTLLVASFAALGLFMSCLTAQPVVAAVSTFGLLLMLWVVDWGGTASTGDVSNYLSYLSLLRHYEPLLKGVFDSSDVVYYVLFISLFLGLSIRHLSRKRLQP